MVVAPTFDADHDYAKFSVGSLRAGKGGHEGPGSSKGGRAKKVTAIHKEHELSKNRRAGKLVLCAIFFV